MASIGRQHDADDKQSASFADLQLGQAVVENTETGEHKRFYNDDAYNLVQANPDKYQVVPESQYIKDKDYYFRLNSGLDGFEANRAFVGSRSRYRWEHSMSPLPLRARYRCSSIWMLRGVLQLLRVP